MTSRLELVNSALGRAFVLPFYLSLLHGNFASGWYDDAHSQRIANAAKTISDDQLKQLFKGEWRCRLTAAWFVGLSRRSSFVEEVAELLLESKLAYAGQGYCVALGLVGGKSCENHLREYLKKYLPFRGRHYDQDWAIGALAHLQGATPQEFLDPARWDEATARWQPLAGVQEFDELVKCLQQHQMIA